MFMFHQKKQPQTQTKHPKTPKQKDFEISFT